MKLDINEGPNDENEEEVSRNENSRDLRQSGHDSDFFKLEDCTSHKSEVVPKLGSGVF